MTALFLIAGGVAVVSAITAISRYNMVHALLNLIVSLMALGLAFFLLGAPFAAVMEVIIYAGAIMVLFLFVIMMCNISGLGMDEVGFLKMKHWLLPAALGLILVAELIYALLFNRDEVYRIVMIGPQSVAVSLFGPYVLCVELVSMLLLAALVGACHIAHRMHSGTGTEGDQ